MSNIRNKFIKPFTIPVACLSALAIPAFADQAEHTQEGESVKLKQVQYKIGGRIQLDYDYFDGVHKAHQTLIEKTIEYARNNSVKSGILTFNSLLYTKSIPLRGLLTTHEEKVEQFNRLGVDNICVLNFVDRLRDMNPASFVMEILKERLRAKTVLVGPGFRFGRGGEGMPEDLVRICNNFNIEAITIPSSIFEGNPISSTRIRMNLLYSGNIEKANYMLGRRYSISGIVTKGAGVGRTIGYPTANLRIDSFRKLIPADGVYACIAHLNDKVMQSSVSIPRR